jgi:hypothetical protein
MPSLVFAAAASSEMASLAVEPFVVAFAPRVDTVANAKGNDNVHRLGPCSSRKVEYIRLDHLRRCLGLVRCKRCTLVVSSRAALSKTSTHCTGSRPSAARPCTRLPTTDSVNGQHCPIPASVFRSPMPASLSQHVSSDAVQFKRLLTSRHLRQPHKRGSHFLLLLCLSGRRNVSFSQTPINKSLPPSRPTNGNVSPRSSSSLLTRLPASAMSHETLYVLANTLGVLAMLTVIGYHFVAVNARYLAQHRL